MTLRQKQKEGRRREILDKSLDLFIRHGYTGTSTREISRALGISSGLLFHYYDTKEQLYLEHLKTALDGIRMMEEYLRLSLSPIEVFRQIAESALSYFAVSPATAKVFLLAKQALYADYLTEEMKKTVREMDFAKKLVPTVRAGQKIGEIRQGDSMALALCYFSAIENAAENSVCFPSAPMPEAEWFVSLLKA
ncbi:Bacterial regulatory proteins, tetR family [Caprobacter fermentans]|uniref:Bacterial regulatory proteins, tetR family n=1 Tax=Caproicibacter fermentans TaxID=2576756 RepID=A0A6N8HWD7_9FIRM|nr:TetR/AcrR family transcriptional regulator [Caproicibacter fermentans]MVB10121.1 Bacterial regulatory proteins, tetR family [Caproicibacter fermentans]QNK40190.1 TetR/AcrR family transcriptional regulator [Caproicibacter fermentans]